MESTAAMTEFIERVANMSAELTARSVVDQLRPELRELSDGFRQLKQTIYGDNGNGVLGQIKGIKRECELRKADCDQKFMGIRAAAEGPVKTVKRWQWMILGSGATLTLLGGLLELHHWLK